MLNSPTHCERCGKKLTSFTMSYFNTQNICMACKERERKHPKYAEARAADEAAIRNGNYNFKGIGLPADLIGGK